MAALIARSVVRSPTSAGPGSLRSSDAFERAAIAAPVATAWRQRPEGWIPEFGTGTPNAFDGHAVSVHPASGENATRLTDAGSGMRVSVRLEGSRVRAGQPVDGYIVYPGASPTGGDVLHRPTSEGFEDFVALESSEADRGVSYLVDLDAAVAGLRLVSNELEFVDGGGAPRLRVPAPFVIDSLGRVINGRLAVTDCAVDTDPRAPWGRAVTAPGASRCRVQVSWNGAVVKYPAVLDPSWTTTGSLPSARSGHVMGVVAGRVTVAGGLDANNASLGSTVAYDVNSRSWAALADMNRRRFDHGSVVTVDGRLFVAGGIDQNVEYLNTTEFFDGTSWSYGPTLTSRLYGLNVMRTNDGYVWITGGFDGTTTLSSRPTWYSTTTSVTALASGPTTRGRAYATAVPIGTNRLMLIGGLFRTRSRPTNPIVSGCDSDAEILVRDPAGTIINFSSRPFANSGYSHCGPGAALSPDGSGDVFMYGGCVNDTTAAYSFLEKFSVRDDAWSAYGSIQHARAYPTSVQLPSGSILITGGRDTTTPVNSSESLVAASGSVGLATGPPLNTARWGGTAVVIPSTSDVLIAGGVVYGGVPTAAVEIYTTSTGLAAGAACAIDSECSSAHCVDSVCCNTACGAGSTGDCQACSVAAGAAVNGVCGVASATTVCRGAAGACDVAESCDGMAMTCPTDTLRNIGTVCRASAGPCDILEGCSGTSAACPADTFLGIDTVCRTPAGACDLAESCSGAAAACPTDTFAAPTTVCRTSAGACDVAESCTGSTANCPADTIATSAVECRASVGACDVAEHCTGSATACPPDVLVGVNTPCRASAGACDVAEACDGVTGACPANVLAPATTQCRAGTSACDSAEFCTGTTTACPPDTLAPMNTVCRAAAGPCDLAEVCSGTSGACPTDQRAPATTVCQAGNGSCAIGGTCDGTNVGCPGGGFAMMGTPCRAPAGPCDVAETCSGSSTACPPDGFASSATVCRTANGACDVAELCTGTSASCPSDVLVVANTVCRAPNGACDLPESCSGSTPGCPTDGFVMANTVCRAANGACDVAESCTGTSASCPADGLAAATTTCRPANGACDVTETCTGTSAACPPDVLANASLVCRTSTGPCDATEACTGASSQCPSDGFLASSIVCRVAGPGGCDAAETCTGTSASCPPDALSIPGTVCRAATGICDVAETCSGSTSACPTDGHAGDGLPCSDALVCNGDETCHAGACTPGTPRPCDDGEDCTADSCGEPGGCTHARIAHCCHQVADCDDGIACTTDFCISMRCVSVPTGTCPSDAGEDVVDAEISDVVADGFSTDGTVPLDSAPVADASPTPDATSGDAVPNITDVTARATDAAEADVPAMATDVLHDVLARSDGEADVRTVRDAAVDVARTDAAGVAGDSSAAEPDAVATDGSRAVGGTGSCGCHVVGSRSPHEPSELATIALSVAAGLGVGRRKKTRVAR